MGKIDSIWVSVGVDLSEFRKGTQEANRIATATVARVQEAFAKTKLNVKSLGDVTREMKTLQGRAGDLKAALVNASPRTADWGKLSGELRAVEQRMRAIAPVAADLKERNEKLAASFGRIGDAMMKAGAIGTAAIAAAGAGAYAAWSQVDEGLDAVAAQTGAVGAELSGLQESFRRVGSTATQQLSEVGNALGTIATITPMRGGALEAFTSQVLDLARVSKGSATEIAANATRAFNAYGVAAQDASKGLDALWGVSQSTGIGLGQLTQEMTKSGASLRALGLSFDQSAALIGTLQKAGMDAEKVLAPLARGIAAMLKAGAADPGKAFVALSERIRGAKTDADASREALKVFGTRGALPLAEAIRKGTFSVETFSAALNNAPGAIRRTVTETDDLKESLQRLGNRARIVIAPVGGAAVDALGKVLDRLRDRFEALEKSGKLQPMLDALSRAMGTVSDAISKLVDWAVDLLEKFAALPASTQAWLVKVAMVTPLVLLLAGAVMKLVQGFIMLRSSMAVINMASLISGLAGATAQAGATTAAVGGLTGALNTMRAILATPPSVALFATVAAAAVGLGVILGNLVDQLAAVNSAATQTGIDAAQLGMQTARRQKAVTAVIQDAGGPAQYQALVARVNAMAKAQGKTILPGTSHVYVQRLMETGNPFVRNVPAKPTPKPAAPATEVLPLGGGKAPKVPHVLSPVEPSDVARDVPPVADIRSSRIASSAARADAEQALRQAVTREERIRAQADLDAVKRGALYAEANYATRLSYAQQIAAKVKPLDAAVAAAGTEEARKAAEKRRDLYLEDARQYRDAQMTVLEATQAAELARIKRTADARVAGIEAEKRARADALALVDAVQTGARQRLAGARDVVATALTGAGDAIAGVLGNSVGELVRAKVELEAAAFDGVTRLQEAEAEGMKAVRAAVEERAQQSGKDPVAMLEELQTAMAAGTAPDWFAASWQTLQNMRDEVQRTTWKKKVELDTSAMKAELQVTRDALIQNVQGLTGNNDQWRAGYAAGVEQGYSKALREAKLNVAGLADSLRVMPALFAPEQRAGLAVGADAWRGAMPAMNLPEPPPLGQAPQALDVAYTATAPLMAGMRVLTSAVDALERAFTGRGVQPVQIVAPLPVPVTIAGGGVAAPAPEPAAAAAAVAVEVAAAPVPAPAAPAVLGQPAPAPVAEQQPTSPPVFTEPDRIEQSRTQTLLATLPPETPAPAPAAAVRPATPVVAPLPIAARPAATQAEAGTPGEVQVFPAVAPPAPVNVRGVADPVQVAGIAPAPVAVPAVAGPPAQLRGVAAPVEVPAVSGAPAVLSGIASPVEVQAIAGAPANVEGIGQPATVPGVPGAPPSIIGTPVPTVVPGFAGPPPVVEGRAGAPVVAPTRAEQPAPVTAAVVPAVVPVTAQQPAPVAVQVEAPLPVAVTAIAPEPVPVDALAPAPVQLAAVAPPVPAAPSPAALPVASPAVPPAAGVAPEVSSPVLPAPVTPAPTLVAVQPVGVDAGAAWQRFVALVQDSIAQLAAGADAFSRQAQATLAPALTPAFTAPTILPEAFAARMAVPEMPAPELPRMGEAATERVLHVQRVEISVNPSPLFDVKVRQGTLDVLREDKLRGRMGATGVADREGRR